MAFNIKVSQIRDFATEVGNTASVQGNTAKVGVTNQQQNTINSTVAGEPTGSAVVLNVVQISQANYNTAVTNTQTVATTLYVING
jgi:hypothetical protein